MKQVLLAFALLFTLSTASAAVQINTDGLTESQKADLVKQAEAMKAQSLPGTALADTTEKWLNIGERFGKMIGSAAREVGVAANEFLNTPVGKLTAAVIVYQYIGSSIIHIFAGVLILIMGASIITYLGRHRRSLTVKHDTETKNIFGNHPVISSVRDKMDDDTFGWSIALYVATVGLATIVFVTA